MAKDKDIFAPPTAEELDMSAPSAEELKDAARKKAEAPYTPGSLESFIRGGEQGLTFGFGDEINAALEASLHPHQGDWLDRYRKSRDESRAIFEAAENAHPVASFSGNVAGAIVPAFFSGGASTPASAGAGGARLLGAAAIKQAAKEGLKTGVKYGAVAGVGGSKSDLTEGDIKGTAKDAILGASLGGALGGTVGAAAGKFGPDLEQYLARVGKSAKTGAETAIDMTPIDPIKQAFMQGFDKERMLVGRKAEKKLGTEVSNTVDEVANVIKGALKPAKKEQERLLDSAEDINATEYLWNVVLSLIKTKNQPSLNTHSDMKKVTDYLAFWLDKVHGLPPEELMLPNGAITKLSPEERMLASLSRDVRVSPNDLMKLRRDLSELGSATDAERALRSGTARTFIDRILAGVDREKASAERELGLPEHFVPMKQLMEQYVPGLNNANAKVSALLDAQKILPDTQMVVNADKYSMTGIEMAKKLKEFLNTVPKDVIGDMGDKIHELANAKYLQEKINAPGLSKKAFSIADTAKGFTYGAANIAGVTLKGLYNASPEFLQKVANEVASGATSAHQQLGKVLSEASTKDRIGRNAVIFAIQQNPLYRDILNKISEGDPNVK